MLKVLDYSVEFPTTGRAFSNQLQFAPGLTAITGRNEAGKTIILEMIGYCLFGKAALRGKATDYRKLQALLELEINGKDVRIDRNPRSETLVVDGVATAVGAEAINKEVPLLLGFGLDVFNIACVAQQGDLGALTEMKPTARRAMIDQLVGLDQLENVEKKCKAEAKTNQTVADSLAVSMVEPVEPIVPLNYAPSEQLEKMLREIEDHQRRRIELLQVTEPVKPEPPVAPEETDVEALEAHENERQAVLQLVARLDGQLAGMPEPKASKEDLDRAIAYAEYKEALARLGPEPEHDKETLSRWEAVLDAQSAAGSEVTCPKCDHAFHPGLTSEQEELAKLDAPLTRAQITNQFRRHELWSAVPVVVEEFEIAELARERDAHRWSDQRQLLADQRSSTIVPVDRSGSLRAARDYQSNLAVFRERDAAYSSKLRAWEMAREELATTPDRGEELGQVRDRVAGSRHFEALVGQYTSDRERYSTLNERVGDARRLGEGYARGSSALSRVRTEIKRELAPSLGYAASSLISSMTGGERRSIVVDEDFDVTVDGQPLQTLSGSGKSVVNLALRIGLGQVLTARVLPIFMGDECDADLDRDRAGTTHETFSNLTDYLSQVIIVTHDQEVVADQYIRLS